MMLKSLFSSFLAALCLCACTDPGPQKNGQNIGAKEENAIRKQFMTANRQLAEKENDEMDYYGKTHKMPFVKTPSGIRYFVYKPSVNGDSIREGMKVTMYYQLSLLDGTPCYSSAEGGPKTFIIGKEHIESGIHKGLQYLKRGDKALLLIPSALAHGLLGDLNKIPPQMPIVYDVEIR
jgi:FKBP-type peptidyl-prolyl cis-trans isomerase FkpA